MNQTPKNKRRKQRGRRVKFTYETIDRIVRFLRAGNTVKVSAIAAGVAESTFHNWRQTAEDATEEGAATPLQRYFLESLTRAREEAEAILVQHIGNAAPRDWRAAAFLLSRRNPAEWGDIQRQQQLGADGQPIDPPKAQPVLVVPPHVDDIHEWSRLSKARVKKARDGDGSANTP